VCETNLKQLRLSGMLDGLEVRTQQARSEQWSHLEFLTRLVQDEVERRNQKQLALRVRRGGLHTGKTLTSFDFGFNPAINRQLVHDLATCTFAVRGSWLRSWGSALRPARSVSSASNPRTLAKLSSGPVGALALATAAPVTRHGRSCVSPPGC
jgi:hypothetical protein